MPATAAIRLPIASSSAALRVLPLMLVCAALASAAEPAQVAELKAGGITVRPFAPSGWAVDVKSGSLLTPPMWQALEGLPELKTFSVGGDAFTDADLARLAKAATLQRLFFNGSGLTDAGLAVLAKLPELRSFGVNHSTKLTASGLEALKDHPTLTAIEFGGCIITDAGVKSIVMLKNLTELRIGHVRITRACFPLIAGLEHLGFLEITPNWDPQAYTPADFAAFTGMKALHELEIHDMLLTYANGLEHLAAIAALKKLKLYWCYAEAGELDKFRAARPDVTLDVQNSAGEDKRSMYEKKLAELQKK